MTPLHWAAERGHTEVVEILLKHGADPYAISKFNKTPHSLACEKKHHDILKLIDDTMKEREAAKSVESLRAANGELLHSLLTPPDNTIQNTQKQGVQITANMLAGVIVT